MGRKQKDETKEKLRLANIGKKYSLETNKKKGHKKDKHHLWGKKRSEETRKKISETRIKNKVGEGSSNPNWKNGVSIDRNKYYREYYIKNKNNPNYRLRTLLRNRLWFAIKSDQKKGSAVKDLGCTIPELKSYLESLFQIGMSWENWSSVGWHIDHKIPLSTFDLTNRNQLLKAIHYTNLQPMWGIDNLKKGKRLKE